MSEANLRRLAAGPLLSAGILDWNRAGLPAACATQNESGARR